MQLKANELACVLAVGALWGFTNPLIKRGSNAATQLSKERGISSLRAHLITPAFLLPQIANQLASVLFIVLLGAGGHVSFVPPAANAVSLVANSLADHYLGGATFHSKPLLAAGIALVGLGVLLCAPQ